jgi:predicted lipoprotein
MAVSACEQNSSQTVAQSASLSSTQPPEYLAYQTFLSELAKNQILPAYQQLEQASSAFSQTVQENCKIVPSTSQQWAAIKAKWVELNFRWQRIQWLRLGPIKDSNLHSRLQYWPDANGAVDRGVGQLFARSSNPSLVQLSQMNVGAQGIPAAEIMLFSPLYQSADKQPRRCELLQVVAANITAIATKVLNEWQVSGDYYQQFVKGQGEFNGVKDTFEELFSTWVTQLTLIKDNKLLYPLGISSPGILPLTEAPYADVSGKNVHINLLALKAALLNSDGKLGDTQSKGLHDLLMQMTGNISIAQRIQIELDNAINISAQFPETFSQQLADETGRQRVQKLIDSINRLQDLLSVDMVFALTLNVGFNSLDGD